MPRISRFEARDILSRCGGVDRDFHALPSADVDAILREADARQYRRPRNANGSRARYFHAYLTRAANRAED